MRNEVFDKDSRLAYNEEFGFYYFKKSDEVARAFIAEADKQIEKGD